MLSNGAAVGREPKRKDCVPLSCLFFFSFLFFTSYSAHLHFFFWLFLSIYLMHFGIHHNVHVRVHVSKQQLLNPLRGPGISFSI